MRAPYLVLLATLFTLTAQSQQGSPASSITTNHAVTEADGTVRMQRVMPLPRTISPEAQAWLSRPAGDVSVPQTLAERRSQLDTSQAKHRDELLKMFPATITDKTVAGVPVRDVIPSKLQHTDRVLICLHGGGFNADSGSYSESIPVAGLTGTRVVSVLYRMAPEHPFPAAVDDAVAVYRELLKTYKANRIGIFGSSAGAGLTLETAVKLKQLKLPMPAALGPFSTQAGWMKAVTRGRSTTPMACAAMSLLRAAPSTVSTLAQPIRRILSYRQSMRTCVVCHRHSSSRVSETCC